MMQMQTPPAGTRAVTKKNVLPIYAIGAVWLIWALLFPLYRLSDYLIAAGVSLIVYVILQKLLPDVTTYEKIPVVETGDELADKLLKTGDEYLSSIVRTAEGIRNADVRKKTDSLGLTCRRIFDFVRQSPKSAGDLRKFLNYYLPTLLKLVKTYALLEQQGVEGENITASKARIAQMLDTMDEAFRKQLDALFDDTAMDVDADITVMESLLAQEGLADRPETDDGGDEPSIELKL